MDSSKNVFKRCVFDTDTGGIRLVRSDKNRFVDGEIRADGYAFELTESDQNHIFRNFITSDLQSRGIILNGADNNRLINNDLCTVSLPVGETNPVVVSPDSTGNVIRNVDCDDGGNDDDGGKDGQASDGDTHSNAPEKPLNSDHDYCAVPE
mgnify:CR=1 FL=1